MRPLSLALAVAAAAASSLLPLAAGQSCQFNGLDFTPLSAEGIISSSDWALFNVYWSPCGLLVKTPQTPALCQQQWPSSGMCRINQFAETAVDIGDWSSPQSSTWLALDSSNMQNYTTPLRPAASSGALLSLRSLQSNCMDDGDGVAKPYTTTIAFLCDEQELYGMHGPLDMMLDGGCETQMAMLTRLACPQHSDSTSELQPAAPSVTSPRKRRKHVHHSLRKESKVISLP